MILLNSIARSAGVASDADGVSPRLEGGDDDSVPDGCSDLHSPIFPVRASVIHPRKVVGGHGSAERINMDDYEYTTTIHGLKVMVNKVGGGTVGKSYSQEDWKVTVMNGDEFVLDCEPMYCGMPTSHAQAARMAAEYASEEIDRVQEA